MSDYTVDCPKQYGKVTFLTTSTGPECPVSGVRNCLHCTVIPLTKMEGYQVKIDSEKK